MVLGHVPQLLTALLQGGVTSMLESCITQSFMLKEILETESQRNWRWDPKTLLRNCRKPRNKFKNIPSWRANKRRLELTTRWKTNNKICVETDCKKGSEFYKPLGYFLAKKKKRLIQKPYLDLNWGEEEDVLVCAKKKCFRPQELKSNQVNKLTAQVPVPTENAKYHVSVASAVSLGWESQVSSCMRVTTIKN